MAKEQSRFLRIVREVWATELPFLKSVDLDEVPKLPKGSNFRCDNYFSERGVCYFVSFYFCPRRQGEFMVTITVSRSRDKSVLDPPVDYTPDPTNVGSYNLAKFLGRPSYWWDLVDVEARINATLVSLGGEPIFTPDYADANVRRPSSYALPFETIAHEAIRDVNDKLRRFVFPKLEISAGTPAP